MVLKFLEEHKKYDIYKDVNSGHCIVYTKKDPVISRRQTRKTIQLFVKQGIDINMEIISYRVCKYDCHLDIDVDEIINRR